MIEDFQENKDIKSLIKPLIDLTKIEMSIVNQLILNRVGSNVEIILEIANHLIESGGKRIRPMITLASAKMFGYEGDHHIKLAAAIEFMHTATLLHDDVVDDSLLRRGQSAAHSIWGNQASILVGDFLLGQAFRLMVNVGSMSCLDILSKTAVIIAEGEVMQLSATRKIEITLKNYLSIVNAKTAALFSAAAGIGPILSGCNLQTQKALYHYGTNLGIAFQLVDDVLDYTGCSNNLGKKVGHDFYEGKVTMPVILSFIRGSSNERLFWKKIIKNRKSDDSDFEYALMLLNKYHSFIDTLKEASRYGENAKNSLFSLKDSPQKDALIGIIDFCIKRSS